MIRIIDFETTGLGDDAQVIESARIDLIDGVACHGWSKLHGATVPIDPGARSAHHIWDCDIRAIAPFNPDWLWEDDWETVRTTPTLYAAHNSAYELRFVTPPKPMVCTYKSALRIWPEAPSHANCALAYWLHDQGIVKLNRDRMAPSHRALPDCYVTAMILKSILDKGVTHDDLILWTSEPAMLPRCPIGEHRGKPWSEVPKGFLNWMLSKEIGDDLIFCAKAELAKR